jgi:hypothetical protein
MSCSSSKRISGKTPKIKWPRRFSVLEEFWLFQSNFGLKISIYIYLDNDRCIDRSLDVVEDLCHVQACLKGRPIQATCASDVVKKVNPYSSMIQELLYLLN